jgi:hypothetical protein
MFLASNTPITVAAKNGTGGARKNPPFFYTLQSHKHKIRFMLHESY